jgi:uncharacterized membrane protein YphA (DoxX/SURF4 family)
MNNFLPAGRSFFAVGILCLGIEQFYDAAFLPVVLPSWPLWMHMPVLAYLAAVALIVAGICILVGKRTSQVSFFLGVFLLALFVFFQASYLLFVGPYSPRHPGLWTDPLKEFALAGGAFIIAGTFADNLLHTGQSVKMVASPKKLIRLGSIFFSITMITFGIDHFLYTETVANMVPAWISGHVFWAYLAGAALVAAGVAILLNIKTGLAALLLAIMIFIWFVVLHLPSVIGRPYAGNGGAVAGAIEAFSFTGIALVIAALHIRKKNPFIEN